MHRNRFEFALERLDSGDWKKFEQLASTFLAAEYPSLRTMASPSGDRGRDAMLFSPSDDSSVLFQYSVTASWQTKIRQTAKRISQEFDEPAMLIYVTNQLIGAQADDLRRDIWKEYKLSLDIKDKSWFLERFQSDPQLAKVAETLAREIVDPYLEDRDIIASKAQALTSIESRAAFVFLGLQLEDDTREKGLTKLSFEALVRAALRGTNLRNRLLRTEVHRRVQAMLPNHPTALVAQRTDSALQRLTKRVVRHWQAPDEFCLTHEESERLQARLIDIERADSALASEILGVIRHDFPDVLVELAENITPRVRRIIEQFLLSQGEVFASSVQRGQYQVVPAADITDHVTRDLGDHPLARWERDLDTQRLADIVAYVLTDPGTELRRHLRSLADAYTLLAFLRETTDVQRAVNKMFSYGNIWLDTNVVLPLFAELLIPEDHWKFGSMVRAATEAGLELHITPGVLEEIDGHMNLSLSCVRVRAADWEGSIPFLYSTFVQSGISPQGFPRWLQEFRGNRRPQDDIAEYLREFFSIKVTSLEEDAKAVTQDLRYAVQEVWQSAHERRRQGARRVSDPLLAARLANHDVENYLGVLHRRQSEEKAPLGYSSWWLTLDKTAFTVERNLKKDHAIDQPSPIMSADFMMNYLALGPVRKYVSRNTEEMLPVALELGRTESLPVELIEIANSEREKYKGLPEHVIRRNVRDTLDAAKARLGQISTGGLQEIEDELVRAIRA